METPKDHPEYKKIRERLSSKHSTIAILDAGAQYGKVIDRRVREAGFMTETFPLSVDPASLEGVGAIIITGGPESVNSATAPDFDPAVLNLDIPTLGICYGNQLIAHHLGGEVGAHGDLREDGPKDITLNPGSLLYTGIDPVTQVLMSHGDSILQLPDGFVSTAKSGEIIASIENPDKKMYGTQFHPEVDLTINGQDMLTNFLTDVAELKPTYTMENKIDVAIQEIIAGVGDKDVYIAVSGGVDSTVAFRLLAEAQKTGLITGKIYAIHVDHGFMREGESSIVQEYMSNAGLDLTVIDAGETFARATTVIYNRDGEPAYQTEPLALETDPEQKRKIIGDTFIQVMEDFMDKHDLDADNTVLIQGTLRPDLIESASKLASGSADTIKTHHNDTTRVRAMRDKGNVIEPLKHLHKDEVRKIGLNLGLPEELVWRQPFPGPGLAIRILAAKEDDPFVDAESYKIDEQLETFRTNKMSASVLPVRTVGVQGDGRTYSHLVALSGKRDWQMLRQAARDIPGSIKSVNRVVYLFGDPIDGVVTDITSTLPNQEAADQLRRADHAVNEVLIKHGLHRKFSQVPVILFPVSFGQDGSRAIGIRTFITNDFMTGDIAVPGVDFDESIVDELVEAAMSAGNISRVVYDLTSKPPGTTEWE